MLHAQRICRSAGVRSGDVLHVSALSARRRQARTRAGGIGPESQQMMENIARC